MNKDTKEWLLILQFILGTAGLGILWRQTNVFIALSVALILWAENINADLRMAKND